MTATTQAVRHPEDGLLSPTPSVSSSMAHYRTIHKLTDLPRPRSQPLRPGSAKEDVVRRYLDDQITHINRRYVKRFSDVAKTAPDHHEPITGYTSLAALCADLSSLINLVWASGTPSLQIPYLLNLANESSSTWLLTFPNTVTSRIALLAVLRKLDHCFASLLAGRDIVTRDPLPSGKAMTRTEMVRCKGIAEQTRVEVVNWQSKAPEAPITDENDDNVEMSESSMVETDDNMSETSESHGFVDPNWDEDGMEDYTSVGQVYEKTLVELGKCLGDLTFSLP